MKWRTDLPLCLDKTFCTPRILSKGEGMKSISQMEAAGHPLDPGIVDSDRSKVVPMSTSNEAGRPESKVQEALDRTDRLSSGLRAWQVGLLSGLAVLLIGFADKLTPQDLTFSLFY